MKNLIYILLIATLFSCENPLWSNTVEQKYDGHCSMILTKSGRAIVTLVWYNGEIVESWYDDMDIVTDSLINDRRIKGENTLKMLEDNNIKVDSY